MDTRSGLLRVICAAALVAAGWGAGAPAARAADPKIKEWVKAFEENARDPFEQTKRERAIRELGRIGGADAARALLPVFEDPFIHLHDRAVSAWIEMVRGKDGADAQTFLSSRALNHRDARVRHGAAVALGATSGAEVETPFRSAASKEKDGAVLAALAAAALRLRGDPALEGVFVKRLKHKDGAAVFQVALAAVRYDGAAAVPALIAALKHRAPLGRAGAVLALQQLDALPPARVDAIVGDKHHAPPMALAESLALRTTALPWPGAAEVVLARLLAHASWRVRAAAIQGALRVWDNRIVEPLIARMNSEEGRLKDDLRRALETYTGQTLGDDPDLWTAWWRQKGPTFDAGERPPPDDAGNIRFRAGTGHDKGEGTRTVAFFNLPLRSKRIAFVFDLSGSMKNVARKGATTGATKIELLRREMEKTLAGLSPDTRFDIFVYRYWSEYPPQTKLTRALGKMAPSSKGNVKKAVTWLNREDPLGWGAFYEPLAALFEEDVDTVVLLSDGRPSRGRYDRDDRLLQEFPRANRFHRVAVNTVLVGTKGADRKFMEALAAATAGRFQEASGE